MAKIHVDDLLVLNRKTAQDDGAPYAIRSYTGQDFKDSVQEVIDDNKLDDRYVLMSGDTMNGQLIIDLGVDLFTQEDVESLTVLGSTKQTQVVISPIVAASELPHASLVFTSTDPAGNRLRDHNIVTDTNLQFRKFYDDEESDSVDMFLMTDEFCYTGQTLRIGNEISTAEVQIDPDGTAILDNVIITQTDPTKMRDDNLIHKIYVDTQLEDVEDRLTELVTVARDNTYNYRNGNQELTTDIKVHEYTSIDTVGGVLGVSLQADSVTNDGDYENGGVYDTSTQGNGSGLKVITAVVGDDVVGVAVSESGFGYITGEEITLVGGLVVVVSNIADGTTYDAPGTAAPVADGQVKWQLFKGATSEEWGEIDTFYFSPKNENDVDVDVDETFPIGQVIDISVDGLESDEYYARYRIIESRIGPSFAVTSTSFANEEEKGLAYGPLNDVTTTSISGEGQGLTIDILEVAPDTGHILDYNVRNPGIGYVAGERVAIEGGISTAILTVDSIETEVSADKQGLLYVGVDYLGFSLEDEEVSPEQPEASQLYTFEIKRSLASQPPVNGIFSWSFIDNVVETFENINRMIFSVNDVNNVAVTQVNFPIGSIVDLINPDTGTSYGRYKVIKTEIKTIGVADPIIEGAINEFDYVDLEVEVDLSDTAVLPKDVSSGFYSVNVTISVPILTEMELEKERVNQEFERVDTSIVTIKEDIDALENSVSSGGLVYGPPLQPMTAPQPGKMYFYTAANNATSLFSDPDNEVVGVVLSSFDFISTSQKEWDAAIQPGEALLYIDDIENDISASYLITTIEQLTVADEVQGYKFGLDKITAPSGDASLNSSVDYPNRVKTRLINDGISREEALETFAGLSGSDIRGKDRYLYNDEPRFVIDPQNFTFTLGYLSSTTTPVVQVHGEDGLHVNINEHRIITVDSDLIEIASPINLANNDGQDLKITGVETDEEEETSATNVGYVQGYVKDYVDGVVGLVRPASSTNLGPLKLDTKGLFTLTGSNQLTIQNASTGSNYEDVGVACYNGTHFVAHTQTEDGVDFTRISAKTLTSGNYTNDVWGMVKVNGSTIKVNNSDELYARPATSTASGVMKVVDHTNKDSVPSWNSDTYKEQAGSARSVNRAHQKAKDAWDNRMYGGKALHTTSTPEIGGIKKSGSTFYLRVS